VCKVCGVCGVCDVCVEACIKVRCKICLVYLTEKERKVMQAINNTPHIDVLTGASLVPSTVKLVHHREAKRCSARCAKHMTRRKTLLNNIHTYVVVCCK